MKLKIGIIFFLSVFVLTNLYARKNHAVFLDKNTLQITAYAKGGQRGSLMRKRARCFQAGKTIAQSKAIEILADKGWANVKGKVTKTKLRHTLKKEMQGWIRGGYIQSSEYDPRRNRCKVVFRIQRQGMQGQYQRAVDKAIYKETIENKK